MQAMLDQVFSGFLAGRRTPTYKIAVFPMAITGNRAPLHGDEERPVVSRTEGSVEQNKALRLHYSYYAEGVDKNIFRSSPVWSRGPRPAPDEANIYRIASTMQVDGVVTTFYKAAGIQYERSLDSAKVTVYVFDAQLGKSYEQSGYGRDLDSMLDKALADFIAGRTQASAE